MKIYILRFFIIIFLKIQQDSQSGDRCQQNYIVPQVLKLAYSKTQVSQKTLKNVLSNSNGLFSILCFSLK